MADCFDKLFVHGIGFRISSFAHFVLLFKKGALKLGIVEFGVGVAKLVAEDKGFKALDKLFFAQFRVAVEFAEGSGFDRVVDNVVGLD